MEDTEVLPDALWKHEQAALQWSAVLLGSVVAAILDLRARRIPNALTGPLFLGGLVWASALSGLAGLGDGLLASVLLALPFVLLFAFAGGGAGDAKLMAALGAWLGIRNGAVVLAAVALSGVILAAGAALARGRLRPVLANIGTIMKTFSMASSTGGWKGSRALLPATRDMQTIPYGVAILAGVCLAGGGIRLWLHA